MDRAFAKLFLWIFLCIKYKFYLVGFCVLFLQLRAVYLGNFQDLSKINLEPSTANLLGEGNLDHNKRNQHINLNLQQWLNYKQQYGKNTIIKHPIISEAPDLLPN